MKANRPGSHRSPFTRDQNARAICLQDRDGEVLKCVWDYGLIPLEGVRALCGFGSRERASIRTRLLFDHGYLDRRFVPTIRGSAKVLHALGPKGVEVVAQRLGQEVAEVRRRRRAALETRGAALPHFLAVTQVRLGLSMALETHRQTKLDKWIGATELPHLFRDRSFVPDGYIRYWQGDKLYACFLEVDMGTESHRRIVKKVKHYLEYGLSGQYAKSFGLRFFRVLLVAPTEGRRDHLWRTIEQVTDKMFWLAVQADVRPDTALGAIWSRPHRQGRFSLLEP